MKLWIALNNLTVKGVIITATTAANTIQLPTADTMLGQGRRRWAIIDPTFDECHELAGILLVIYQSRLLGFITTILASGLKLIDMPVYCVYESTCTL